MSVKKTFLGVELSSSKKVNTFVFSGVVILLIAIIVGYIFNSKYNELYMPMYIDSSKSEGVVFNIDHSLTHTDNDGTMMEQMSYKSLGIKEVADVKFYNHNLLVLQGDGKLKQCTLPLGSCSQIGSVSSYRADIFMRLVLSKDSKYFYVVQTNKSKIDKFDKEGTHLYRLKLSKKQMQYPAGGVALSDDVLLIADTKHKRVIAIQDVNQSATTLLWTLSSKSDMLRHSYKKVLDVKLDEANNIWMTNTNKDYEKSDILMMDIPQIKALITENAAIEDNSSIEVPDGHARRVESKSIYYPESLAPHKHGMLVADRNKCKIYYIDDTQILSIFGDGYVQSQLRRLYQTKEQYLHISNLSAWMFGLAMLLVIMGGILEVPLSAKKMMEEANLDNLLKPLTISNAKVIEPDKGGVIWLYPQDKLLTQLKWLKRLFYASIPFSLYFLFHSFSQTESLEIYFLENAIAISLPSLFLYGLKQLDITKHAIGLDETDLYIRTSYGEAHALFEKVLFSTSTIEKTDLPTQIAIDNTVLSILNINDKVENSIFDKEQFDYYIKPKLIHAKHIAWTSMLGKQIKSIDLKSWLVYALPLIIMGIIYIIATLSKS